MQLVAVLRGLNIVIV